MSASIPLIEQGVIKAEQEAPHIASSFSSFWKSLSSLGKGPGGKVLKVGAQVGTAVALPGAGIYTLNKATAPIQKGIEQVTGVTGSGSLLVIGILAFLAIMFLLVVFR